MFKQRKRLKQNLSGIECLLPIFSTISTTLIPDLISHVNHLPKDQFQKDSSLSLQQNIDKAETWYDQFERSVLERKQLQGKLQRFYSLLCDVQFCVSQLINDFSNDTEMNLINQKTIDLIVSMKNEFVFPNWCG